MDMKPGISEDTSEFLSGSSRRDVLSSLRVLERRERDEDLRELTELAMSLSETDAAQISLVNEEKSSMLAHAGRDRPVDIWAIEASALAASDRSCLVVLNAAEDVRYSAVGAVARKPNIRFIAVAPICVSGECIGALSVLSREPKTQFGSRLQAQLMHLARLAGSIITLKRESRDRTDAMTKLHLDEDRNSMALEVGNVGSWVWDLRTGRFSGNRKAYSMLGLDPEQPISGEDVFRAMHPDDFPVMKSAFTRALVNNQDYIGEFRAAASGQWLLGRGRVFERDAQGKPVVAVGVNIDITDTKNAAEKTRLLLRELNHRVKNTLAMLQSLARQTLNRTSDPAEFMEAFSGRLRAISEAHTLLSDREWSGISLVDLLAKQVEPYAIFSPQQIELAGEDIVLPPDHALGLGIALHELATNAARHGALSIATGHVRITWQIEPGLDQSRVVIHWAETGGPRVSPPEARGLGERLIERSLDKVLSSSVRLSYLDTGLEAVISMPVGDDSHISAGG